MSFKITIINNETGETILEREDAAAIIGAVTTEKETAVLGFTNCNGGELLCALKGNDKARDAILNANPIAKLLYDVAKAMPDED